MAHNLVHKQQEDVSELWGIITQRSRRNMPTQEMGTLKRVGHEALQGLGTYGEVIDWTNKQVSVGKLLDTHPSTYNISKQLRKSKIGDDILNFSYHDARQGVVKWIGGKNQAAGVAANILMPDAVDFATGGLGYYDNLLRAGAKYGGKLINKGDDVIQALGRAVQRQSPQVATAGGPALNRVADGLPNPARPLQMTGDQAADSWRKATHPETVQYRNQLTPAQRDADNSLSKVVRYVSQGRWQDLPKRMQNSAISTAIQASPIKYLIKYSGNRIMKAESHHILDLDFWGRALNIDNADMVTHALYKGGIKTGNHSRNIVWAWADKSVKSTDHNVLHKLYDSLPSRIEVESLMADGRWFTMKPDAQAKYLAKVAYEQHRVTNNFFRKKLSLLKEAFPQHFAGKNAKQIRKMFIEDLEQGGTAFAQFRVVADHKNPEHIQKLLQNLSETKYSGKNNDELRTIFGLETPHAANRSWSKSTSKSEFDLRLSHRLNQAKRMREIDRAKDLQILNKSTRTYQSSQR